MSNALLFLSLDFAMKSSMLWTIHIITFAIHKSYDIDKANGLSMLSTIIFDSPFLVTFRFRQHSISIPNIPVLRSRPIKCRRVISVVWIFPRLHDILL